MLGLPEVTHYVNQPPPMVFTIVDAMNAIFSGSADVVLAYHAMYRNPAVSRSAAADPLRRNLGWAGTPAGRAWRSDPESVAGSVGYTAWASRYLHEYGADESTSATSPSTTGRTRRATRWPPCASRSRWTTTSPPA